MPGGAAAAVVDRAADLHLHSFGAAAAVRAVAPGRINIIGEHTDYAGGLCLPAAVDRHLAVAVGPADKIELVSEQQAAASVSASADALAPVGGWADLPLGVLSELAREGVPIGARIAVASDIPVGAGLSSSAALGVAVALAVLELGGREMAPLDVARLCRRAENEFLGVPSGLMDQAASVMGRAGSALLFDAGAEIVEPAALPPRFAWLVIESGIDRSLRGSAYGDRAAEAAAALEIAKQRHPGLRSLCGLDPSEVEALVLPAPLDQRARHIAGECRRVRMAVACIEADNVDALGQLMVTSHRSLARDCEVSLPELDEIVEVALEAGCAGARLMGAGFGGSVLALTEAASVDSVAERIMARLGPAEDGRDRVLRVEVVDGARTIA